MPDKRFYALLGWSVVMALIVTATLLQMFGKGS